MDIDVLKEHVSQHDRRIDEIGTMMKDNVKSYNDLFVLTARHSEQIDTLIKVVYGTIGIILTSAIWTYIERKI